MLLPTSYKTSEATVIAPVPLVDIFSVWNNVHISSGNKNGVFAYISDSVNSGRWNSGAVVPYKVKDDVYFECRMDSGVDMNHGVGIDFKKKLAYENLPDQSQWVVTNSSFTIDGGILFFQGSATGAGKDNGLNVDCSEHTTKQRDLRADDIIQLAVSYRRIELTVYDDTSKAIIFNISYLKPLAFNFEETLYPVFVCNHVSRGFSAKVST